MRGLFCACGVCCAPLVLPRLLNPVLTRTHHGICKKPCLASQPGAQPWWRPRHDRATTAYSYKPEKNWKLLYTRDAKLARARQLGFTYPVLSARQLQEQE